MKNLMNVAMLTFLAVAIVSCDDDESDGSKVTETYDSEMVIKWLNIQARMLRVPLPVGVGAAGADRAQGYCGIALYEAVVQGMPAQQTLQGQLTDFPTMPEAEPGMQYHWAASGNAALAEMNRRLFPTASAANKASVDSLEAALQASFATDVDAETLQRSIEFGKAVASTVFDWAATDGSANSNPPYVPSGAPGTWVSTPPNFPAAFNAYASQRRLLVPGVADGTTLSPLPVYSTVAGSAFYNMVKDVYDKSVALTPAQTAAALYTRDTPGYPGGAHFVLILSQTLSKALPTLDIAAVAYAKVGITQHDATVICFSNKYLFDIVRPITYIRNEMGYTTWNALFNTPGHPEFPSGHSTISSAVAEALTDVFGDNFAITLNTYAYIGLPDRSFTSFRAMAKEFSDSRVFSGIHYQETCDKSGALGKKVAENVLSKVNF